MKKADIEETIFRLHQEGLSAAAIGVRLRDGFGVPSVRLATGRSLLEILRSKGAKFALPEDLAGLIRRAASLQTHLKEHGKDLSNKRGLNSSNRRSGVSRGTTRTVASSPPSGNTRSSLRNSK